MKSTLLYGGTAEKADDGKRYKWDEEIINWVDVQKPQA